MTEQELDKLLESLGIKETPPVQKGKGKKKKQGASAPQKQKAPEAVKEAATPSVKKTEKTPEKTNKNPKNANKGGQKGEKKKPEATPETKKPQGTKPAQEGKKHKAQGGKVKSYKKSALRVFSLGGLGEIGKNITALEYGNDIIVIDCGMGFPDEDMPGVDLVIPDFTYLVENQSRVRAVLLTHGHEDHIGGVPYLLKALSDTSVTVYGTPLTLGILKRRLEEFRFEKAPKLRAVAAGDTVYLGEFAAEFIHVNHSIADSCAIAVYTPVGTVVHSGDFKLDVSPIDGKMMDLARLGQIGNDGVKLLLCESTNAERGGYTPSERKVGGQLEQIFLTHKSKRLVVATFSSNVHRVQQIIDASARHGRRVAVLGRSMVNVIGAARELGYMDVPDGVLIELSEMKRFRPEELTLVTTGSQGEPMSALYRMAFGEHDRVKLDERDLVVISASAIPGNEKYVGNIVNALVKNGISVIDDSMGAVHVSGHACAEELKLMHALLHPEYFMPIHGESRHLGAHRDIAKFLGMTGDRIFVSEIGKVLEIDEHGARFADTVPSGNVLIDGSGVGDVGSVVLRDRKHLAEDGLIVAAVLVDRRERSLVSGPDLITRGFVYAKESGDLIDEAREAVKTAVEGLLFKGHTDPNEIKTAVKDTLGKLLFKKTKRRPMVLPIVTEI